MPDVQVGFITQWYDPEIGAAAVSGSIARTLVSRGHDVKVLTGYPNYPAGEIYPGYRQRPYGIEFRDGVEVHRAPLYLSHDDRPASRAANYLSFAASAGVVGLKALRQVDAALVYSGPITAAIPAIALRALAGVPYVLLVEDMWPQSVTASGFLSGSTNSRVERLLHRACDAVYRRAARIAVTSPGMADLIVERGVPRSKIALVPNWADESVFRPMANDPALVREFGPFRPFTAMYAGNLGDVQGLEVMVDAASILRERDDIGFVFVGSGVAEKSLRERVAQHELSNVRFLGSLPMERMSQMLALGDVQVVSLRDRPVFRSTLPSKLQATLAAGRPVVGSVAGDAATLIDAAGAGRTVQPGSAPDLAQAIDDFSRMPDAELARLGANGRRYYDSEFSRSIGGLRLERLLEAAASTGRQR